MQAHVENLHEEEGQRQHQRDRERDDDAAAHPKREKRHGEHDQHRFSHRTHKLTHRGTHRARLVRHARKFKAHGQVLLHFGERLVQAFAQGENVAAFFHRHANSECVVPHVAHFGRRWFGKATLDFSDIAQANRAARRSGANANRCIADLLNRGEIA